MSGELTPEARARLLADARELAEPQGELLHGRYRLLHELGRGGMGVVYEAEDVALRRRVALKRLSLPAGIGPGLAEQVLREARAAARLDHPNIAAVYDAHDDAIAMQFVDGPTLAEMGPVPVRELVGWMRDAARAVHHAHEQGIVHRDLKPHNLMVSEGRVVVTDFGLAKELAVDSSLSLSGSILGTPSYMPPEQASGRARDVDARSDVYALGATLYDRLAGRPPFVETDLVALLRAVVEDEPGALRALAPEVPRDLALVVHKCLAKEKARRYGSAAELAEDLERWLTGRPVLAKAPSFGYRLMKSLHRHRVLAGAATVLLLGGLAAVAWNWTERRERAVTEEALELAEHVNVLLENAKLFGVGEGRRSELDALEEGIARCQGFLARHPATTLIEAKLGRLLREASRHDEALAAFERVLARQPGYEPARLERGILLSILHAERVASEGDSPVLQALRKEALSELSVVDDASASLREKDLRRARAERAHLEGRLDEAQRLYEDLERIGIETPPALAALALARGDPDEAFRQAMSAVDLQRGFAPAYLAQSKPDTPAEAAARAIRQHERSANGRPVPLHIEGIPGPFTDWAARLAERKSTAAAFAHRATGEVRRAARFLDEGKKDEALNALGRAVGDLGDALTIDPRLDDARLDRMLVELERARLLAELGRQVEAQSALERARVDLQAERQATPEPDGLEAVQLLYRERLRDVGAAGLPGRGARDVTR